MKQTAQEIATLVGGDLRGDGGTILESVASLKNAGPLDLTYAEERFHDQVPHSRAGCVIVGSGNFHGTTVILARNPKLAFARAAHVLMTSAGEAQNVHNTAIIAPDATLGQNVRIGPGAVIESGVTVGNNSTIEAGSYIGRHSTIGEGCTIYPRVVIYHDVEV